MLKEKVRIEAKDGVLDIPHYGITIRVLVAAAVEHAEATGILDMPVFDSGGHQIATLHLKPLTSKLRT